MQILFYYFLINEPPLLVHCYYYKFKTTLKYIYENMSCRRLKFDTVVLFLLCCCFTATFGLDTVKYVAVIFRHGQRTPEDPYPTDPWRNESLWPVRFGELTNTGKKQHYALGQWLRKRYSGLISERFDPDEVYVKSTDYDRTLMSAQVNLAGLYPPVGDTVWDDKLAWQPIPIHSESLEKDSILAMELKCKAYDDELEKYKTSEGFKQRLSKYQELMDYLTAYTGRKIKDFDGIEYLYSNLYIETLFNFSLPDWTHAVFPDKMAEPAGASFAVPTGTPRLARLRAGPLLKHIMSKMKQAVKSKKPVLKFSMFSGHDNTISSILNALEVFDGVCPVFTATVIFELIHDDTNNNYYIKVFYRNSTKIIEPHLLTLPYCEAKCPVERFQKLYQHILDVNWEAECGYKDTYYTTMGYILIILLLIFVVASMKEMALAYQYGYSLRTKPSDLTIPPTTKSSEIEILTHNENKIILTAKSA